MRPIVSYQGEPGAFSEGAAHQLVAGEIELLPCETFVDALRAVEDARADFAAIPIHNITAGPVHAAVAALNASTMTERINELKIHIHLALMCIPGATIERVREAHSHQMAIGQCGKFLATHPWIRAVVAYDTAGAARLISEHGDPAVAAIAAPWAAARYGLVILAEGLEDRSDNLTTFVLVRKTSSA